MNGYANICELGQVHATHPMVKVEGEMRIQGKPALGWVYEVARDCKEIDEVQLVAKGMVVSFKIDRDYEPPRITVDQYATTQDAVS